MRNGVKSLGCEAAVKASVEILIVHHAGHNWRRGDADIEPSREVIVQRRVQFSWPRHSHGAGDFK